MRVCLSIVASVFLFGCASAPPVIDYAQLEALQPLQTTKADVVAMFGEPARVQALADGQEEWQYDFSPLPLTAPAGLPAPAHPQRPNEVLRIVFLPTGQVFMQEVTRSGVQIGGERTALRRPFGPTRK